MKPDALVTRTVISSHVIAGCVGSELSTARSASIMAAWRRLCWPTTLGDEGAVGVEIVETG